MAWYRAGTVGVTNGSTTVALSGGNALANIFPGDSFLGPDGRAYEVALVTSATSFTLATAYQGATATGQPYAIQPTGSTGALRLLNDQVSDLVTNYQTGRDAWASAPASTLKGRKSGGAGAVENLTPADVLTLLSGGTPGALTGTERLPVLQGTSAVGLTVNQLLSRAAGQALPFEIGGQRVVTIGANGLGVGTPAPAYGVEVYGGSNQAKSTVFANGGADAPGTLRLGAGGSAYALSALPGASGITFTQVGIGEQARLYQGSFLVGQVAPNWGFVNKAPGVTIAAAGLIKVTRNELSLMLHRTDSNGPVAQFGRDTSVVGSIAVTESATAFNTASDYRLKDDVVEIGPVSAIDRVKQLRPVRFSWLSTGEVVDGFLAHEAQAVVPEAVTGEKDAVEEIGDAVGYRERDPETGVPILGTQETLTGITQAECPEGYVWTKTGERPVYQGIDQSKLVPLLAAGLKAAIGEIEALQARVAALESAA